MSVNPNSPLSRLRLWLVVQLNIWPDAGETWCVGCRLNGRRTMILSPAGTDHHGRLHAEAGGAASELDLRSRQEAEQA